MNSKYLLSLAVFGTLLFANVYSRPQQNNLIPDWVTNALSGSTEAPTPAIPIAGISATTRRPQLADIIGTGLQGLFQGIVRAPGQIANRVQSIIDGIIRRPSTTTASPIPIIG